MARWKQTAVGRWEKMAGTKKDGISAMVDRHAPGKYYFRVFDWWKGFGKIIHGGKAETLQSAMKRAGTMVRGNPKRKRVCNPRRKKRMSCPNIYFAPPPQVKGKRFAFAWVGGNNMGLVVEGQPGFYLLEGPKLSSQAAVEKKAAELNKKYKVKDPLGIIISSIAAQNRAEAKRRKTGKNPRRKATKNPAPASVKKAVREAENTIAEFLHVWEVKGKTVVLDPRPSDSLLEEEVETIMRKHGFRVRWSDEPQWNPRRKKGGARKNPGRKCRFLMNVGPGHPNFEVGQAVHRFMSHLDIPHMRRWGKVKVKNLGLHSEPTLAKALEPSPRSIIHRYHRLLKDLLKHSRYVRRFEIWGKSLKEIAEAWGMMETMRASF